MTNESNVSLKKKKETSCGLFSCEHHVVYGISWSLMRLFYSHWTEGNSQFQCHLNDLTLNSKADLFLWPLGSNNTCCLKLCAAITSCLDSRSLLLLVFSTIGNCVLPSDVCPQSLSAVNLSWFLDSMKKTDEFAVLSNGKGRELGNECLSYHADFFTWSWTLIPHCGLIHLGSPIRCRFKCYFSQGNFLWQSD